MGGDDYRFQSKAAIGKRLSNLENFFRSSRATAVEAINLSRNRITRSL